MLNFLARHWKTVAITSVSLTSSYLYSHYDHSQLNNRLSRVLTVQAAEYEQRNAGKASLKHRHIERSKQIDIDDDDDDDDDENDEEELDKADENNINFREKRFRDYASLEYNGEIFMTPVDFLESMIAERPRPRIGRRQLTDEMIDSILYITPPKHRESKRFFRDLEEAGLVSFTEYLFLWIILTKPATEFEIAFAMFDLDGNRLVDKREFLMFGKVMSDKRMLRRPTMKRSTPKLDTTEDPDLYINLEEGKQVNTTLLLHFFGKNGRDTLNYAEFKNFMDNFQIEILELEFAEFSHGFKTISDLDFAQIILRYTDIDRDKKRSILKRVRKSADQPNAITFEQFQNFFAFLNNLEEFSLAMRFQQLSNRPISQAEFQRAIKVSTGRELEPHIISLIFRIFDEDGDQHLSYDEFMAVMKDRLSRGFHASDYTETSLSRFDQFKHCFHERAKSTITDEKHWFGLWKNELFL